jgi:protoporphyrinogen/coproporphyrinogen III oxidase
MKIKRIAIAGAGITGLVAAWNLQKKGHEVTLFERRDQPGGSVKTVLENGWLAEYGPNTIQLKNNSLLGLFRELGLDKRMVVANTEASSRYIVKNGTLTALPGSFGSAFSTPLVSWKGKMALLKEPFVSKGTDPDETLASFAERR